jgi:hypothetical protein
MSDGTRAEPPSIKSTLTNWRGASSILLSPRTLRVVGIRGNDADQAPALVVEDCPDQQLGGQPEG